MIKWIFFDVGNVILNDDPAMAEMYRHIFNFVKEKHETITLNQLLKEREYQIIHKRDGRHYASIMEKYLNSAGLDKFKIIKTRLGEKWAEISPLMTGIVPVIEELSKSYKLGLIANQPEQVVDVLNRYNLLKYFEVQALSDIVGLRKPDTRFFKYALTHANCKPEEAIMIGDRLDNDVYPAKSIGMRTIWLKLAIEEKGYIPATEFERQYLESVTRASASRLDPGSNDEQPDFTATFFLEILKGIYHIDDNQT